MFMLGWRRTFGGRSFSESLKALEADIQHANALAAELPREYHGTCLQMRLSFSPAAHLFLFLFQWADCCSLAGSLGLLRILIYKVYPDGRSSITLRERKATIREFYAVIYPALQQLQVTGMESAKAKLDASKNEKLKKGTGGDWDSEVVLSDAELLDQECGICMEINTKIVLPGCNHAMCIACFREWHARSQSCPFCRDSLKRVSSKDLWIFTDGGEIADVGMLHREDLFRLFMYIDKLPVLISSSPNTATRVYDVHMK